MGSVQAEDLHCLWAHLGELLAQRGFHFVEPKSEDAEGEDDPPDGRMWFRQSEWKTDVIYTRHRTGAVRAWLSLQAQVLVRLGDEREAIVDTTGTEGDDNGRYRLHGSDLGGPAFLARVADDTEELLKWLALFDTPAACVSRLRSRRRNGIGVRTDLYKVELPRLGGQPMRGDHGSPYGQEEASEVHA